MKMANLIAVVVALLIAGVFILVYMNRASSEVVGAALPVLFAALSALALVFAFGKPAPIERSFPVVFVFRQADKYPILVPHRRMQSLTLKMFDEAMKANPKLLDDPQFNTGTGTPLFHFYFQKAVINWLSTKYWNTWRIRIERFNTGGEQEMTSATDDAGQFKTKKLSADEVLRIAGSNVFANVPPFGPGTLALPPGTSIEVKEPHKDSKVGETSEIRFTNWLCDVRIRARFGGYTAGLGGYTMFIGMPQQEAQDKFGTVEYIVNFSAAFEPFLKGHPGMAAHREWVEGMLEGLRHEFDEELIWQKATEAYTLWKQLPEEAKKSPLLFGPIRSHP